MIIVKVNRYDYEGNNCKILIIHLLDYYGRKNSNDCKQMEHNNRHRNPLEEILNDPTIMSAIGF